MLILVKFSVWVNQWHHFKRGAVHKTEWKREGSGGAISFNKEDRGGGGLFLNICGISVLINKFLSIFTKHLAL